jgi:hypothetical protein
VGLARKIPLSELNGRWIAYIANFDLVIVRCQRPLHPWWRARSNRPVKLRVFGVAAASDLRQGYSQILIFPIFSLSWGLQQLFASAGRRVAS